MTSEPAARRILLRIAAFAACLFAVRPALACDPAAAKMIGFATMYEGTIGPYPVRVGLQFEPGGVVAGRYAYPASPGTIRLAGRLVRGQTLMLTEFGGGGTATATFAGTMPGRGDDACAAIRGTWTQDVTGRALGFSLRLSDSSMRPLAFYTSPAALRIERAAAAFRTAVLGGRRAAVAAAIRYPVFVSIGSKRMHLPDAAAFRARYDAIFTPAFIARIRADVPHLMFVRDQGMMLGNGEAWFDDDGAVIALNS